MLDAAYDDGPSDADLLQLLRAGDLSACDVLFRRHADAARRMAAYSNFDSAEREDVVAEAFLRVLVVVRAGNGPREHVRPYLLATVRNLVADRGRLRSRTALYGAAPEDLRAEGRTSPEEVVIGRCASGLAWAAFRSLPGRWRTVLWHLEVEGASHQEVASLLGISSNAVAALALRAREGLRKAYLQVQVPDSDAQGCRFARPMMGAWIRGRLSHRLAERVADHLAGCGECRALAETLSETNEEVKPPDRSNPRHYRAVSAVPLLYEAWRLTVPGGPGAGLRSVAVAVATIFAVSNPPFPVERLPDADITAVTPAKIPRSPASPRPVVDPRGGGTVGFEANRTASDVPLPLVNGSDNRPQGQRIDPLPGRTPHERGEPRGAGSVPKRERTRTGRVSPTSSAVEEQSPPATHGRRAAGYSRSPTGADVEKPTAGGGDRGSH